ncbi:hypothetical protein Tco_0488979 [Tanacetum coccineum]
MHTAMNSLAKIIDYQSMEKSYLEEYSECVQLKAEFSKKKDLVKSSFYNELIKDVAHEYPTFFEINDLKAHLQAKNNSISKLKDHIATLEGKEHADTLCEIVEHARALNPLDKDLDSACKFATRIQELLAYVSATKSRFQTKVRSFIVDTPINKTRKVRFLALGWHLEEIHVTWAHLEKKRTHHDELFTQSLEWASQP